MPAQSIIERSFSGGELSPALFARTDQVKYSTGARTLRNMICMRHGGVTQRPGTQYIGTTLNGGNPVRFMPFIFNETGNGQSYVLEFGNFYVAFYQNGGVVISGATPYKVVTPYAQADLALLNFAQCNDVVTITHQNYAPRDLTRVAPTNWTLTLCTFDGVMGFLGTFPVASGGTVFAGPPIQYAVMPVAANGDEGALLNFDDVVSAVVAGNPVQPSVATPVVLNWTPPVGAVSYRIYKFDQGSFLLGNVYGFIGVATGSRFSDNGLTADYSINPSIRGSLYNLVGSGQYPKNVGYVQQRRIFSNVPSNPIGAWASAAGSFTNFNIETPTVDSNAYFFNIAGDEVNEIQHILELKFMLALTSGAELFVQGNGSGVVTPSAINAVSQSYYGTNPLRPIKVGEVCIFLQALGNFVRDLGFDFVTDGYRGNDLTVFSAHLFEGHQIVDWSYQKIPDSILWAVREDGVLLSLTYVREQQILAWTRHDFTNGFVENIVSIPENGNYAVYVVIRRAINGSTVRYVERISSRIWSDVLTATYLDCFLSFDGRNTSATQLKIYPNAGSFDTTDRAYEQLLILSATAATFNAGMIGEQFFLNDSAGNQIRCTVADYISTTQLFVYPNRVVPASLQNTYVTDWAQAVKNISGLTHLAGQSVSVWADRFLVGSPLNKNVTTTFSVTSGGTLALDKPYSVIYIGLPMITDFETLDIDTGYGESILDQPKLVSRVVVYLYNTRGFFGGTKNPDLDPNNIVNGVVQDSLFNLFELKDQAERQTYDESPLLLTDPEFTNIPCNWAKGGRIFIRNVDPIPLSILAVIPAGLTAAKNPDNQKV